ncbi:KxYKxGKxW signal peptide domain-containing protein [Enterococcus columbae]|uniref:KxYKxGKxW signal peptide domain-containing protein n=1 Tax=Enterococcus columbae TaxID=1355 RepID=UPI0024812F7D|nr:KxYKxGKxW signal peptide domain-containing protein [Enterococcus columbae]
MYKMYKSKKNWVVAPVVLVTLLGAFAPATISLGNVVTVAAAEDMSDAQKDALNHLADLTAKGIDVTTEVNNIKTNSDSATILTNVKAAFVKAVENGTEVNGYVVNFDNDLKAKEDALTKLTLSPTEKATYTFTQTIAKTTDKDGKEVAFSTDTDYKQVVNSITGLTAADYQKLTDALAALEKAYNYTVQANQKVLDNATEFAKQNVDFATKVATAKSTVAALADLTNSQRLKFESDLKEIQNDYNNATAEAQKISVVSSSSNFYDRVDSLVNTTKGYNNTTLQTAKDASTQLSGNTLSLDASVYDSIKKQFNDATTVAQIQSLNQQYFTAVIDQKAKLAATWGALYKDQQAQKDALVTYYKDKVKAATTPTAMNQAVTDFGTKALLDSYTPAVGTQFDNFNNINPLKVADYKEQYKQTKFPVESMQLLEKVTAENTAALAPAKTDAKTAIDGLANLTQTQKDDYKKQIDAATRVYTATDNGSVINVLNVAKEANASSELNTAKEAAKKAVQGLPENATADVSAITSAANVTAVKQAVLSALETYRTGKVAAATSAEQAVKDAQAVIDLLDYIQDKDAAKKELATKTTAADVSTLLETYLTLNKTEFDAEKDAQALADAKAAALNEKLPKLTYLTEEQVKDFTAKINAAKSATDVEKVFTTEGTGANAVNATNRKFELETKPQAKADFITDTNNYYTNLTAEQKANVVAQIEAAKSQDDIDKALDAAKKLSAEQTTDLGTLKSTLNEYVNDLSKLSSDKKTAYTGLISAATSLDEARSLYQQAVAENNKLADKALVEELQKDLDAGLYNSGLSATKGLNDESLKAEWTKKFQDALDLVAAKEKLVKAIADSELTPTKKAELTKEANAAKSLDDVKAVQDKLDELAPATAVQLYRAYNPNSGEHLYTADKAEYDHLVSLGWKGEGDAWKAASKGAPVYRLYNPNSGEHFYTISESEYNDVAKAGWKKEGVAFYSDANKGVEVFRLFNPNAKGAGSHHYTTLASERDDLIKAGWKYENVAFFGLK